MNKQLPCKDDLNNLIVLHKELLRQHATMMDYASHFTRTVEKEHVARLTCFQRVQWLFWLLCFKAKCCLPKEEDAELACRIKRQVEYERRRQLEEAGLV